MLSNRVLVKTCRGELWRHCSGHSQVDRLALSARVFLILSTIQHLRCVVDRGEHIPRYLQVHCGVGVLCRGHGVGPCDDRTSLPKSFRALRSCPLGSKPVPPLQSWMPWRRVRACRARFRLCFRRLHRSQAPLASGAHVVCSAAESVWAGTPGFLETSHARPHKPRISGPPLMRPKKPLWCSLTRSAGPCPRTATFLHGVGVPFFCSFGP